jgi:hypothetical protein
MKKQILTTIWFLFQSSSSLRRPISTKSCKNYRCFDLKSKSSSSIEISTQNYVNLLIPIITSSSLLPILFNHISDSYITSFDRQVSVLGLLILKRVFLYWTAFSILDFSSQRLSQGYIERFGEVKPLFFYCFLYVYSF